MPDEVGLERLPEAALQVDAGGVVVAANRLAAALAGGGPGAIDVPALDLGTEVVGFRQWLDGSDDGVFRGRMRARRPNGVPVTAELHARRLDDGSGGALCLIVEPDRERVAEEAERYFDIAFDSAPIGMALFNTDGQYVRVNTALCDLLGRAPAGLLGRRDQEFTHPDDRQSDVDAAWRILRGEISSWQCEKRFLRPDGNLVWVIANLTFLRDGDGNPVSWVGQFQDITERKRDEKQRQETLSLLSATLDATADGILVVERTGRIASFNGRFAEMWRLPEPVLASGDDAAALASVLGQLVDPDAFVAKVDELYHHPEAESDDVLHFLDGRTFERTSKPQRVGGEIVGRVWSFHDITERRRLAADLAAALAEAQEASRLKSVFLATMSHEIRTPMNGVLGLAELLLDSDLDTTQRGHLLALRDSGHTLMALINDILDFSKIEAGKLELEEIEFEVADCVRSVTQMLSTAARQKGLTLRLDLGDGVPGRVRGDPLRLRQVLVNLAANAVKFSESGAVVLGVAAVEPNRLRFTVTDTGIGIDPAVRDSLLQPFSQADSSTTRRFGGTGLGLAICAQLVELMGGTLDFHSRLGEGSTFWFEVPLPTATPTSQGPTSQGPASEGPAPGSRVLLADTSRTHQLVGAAVLARLGWLVDVVANGAEAVDAVRRTRYDAVLMACEMPVMDGYEATRLIRRLEAGGPHTLIVAVTASALAGERQKCIDAGMDDCLSKPFDQATLAGVLSRCCASA